MRRLKDLNTISKVAIGFIGGAVLAGGVATAAVSLSGNVVNACVDNKTGALFASTASACPKGRSAVTLGTGSTIKFTVQKIQPSVITVNVKAADGSGDTGSGSIIKSDSSGSYIVTNNHVIDIAATSNTTTITITLNDGTIIPATLVGRDISYDLAVLRVSTGNLPVIPTGDATKLSIGDPVIAFGSPLGLNGTVTSGIVSSLNRPVTTQSSSASTQSFVDAIQTDAPINPGNSGGPLTDSEGNMIGINTAIASLGGQSTSGSIGLGFAIPINEAQRTINEIITSPTHTSTRPLLGVSFDTSYTGVGAKISLVTAGGAASNAGIPVGAIVTNISGTRTPDAQTAIVKIRSYAPGSAVTVTCKLPDGSTKVYTVTLGSAPSNN
jgi:putative serine protease PepD